MLKLNNIEKHQAYFLSCYILHVEARVVIIVVDTIN